MSEENKSAMLVGASGLVGKELLNYLLEGSNYKLVKVFVRKRISNEHPKLEQIVGDFDQLETYKGHFQVDDLYCCLGTTIKKAGSQENFRKVDYEYPITLCKMAKESGVQRFLIVTALGANAKSRVFYSRIKGEVEEELKRIGVPSLHIFQPSLLVGKRDEFRFGEKVATFLSPLLHVLLVGGLRKYRAINAQDVAFAMFTVGQSPQVGIFTYPSDQIERLSFFSR